MVALTDLVKVFVLTALYCIRKCGSESLTLYWPNFVDLMRFSAQWYSKMIY